MATPKEWSPCQVDLEAEVLLGFTDESMHVVAPPAVRFRPDEPDSQRVLWRHIVWFLGEPDEEPAVSTDMPDEVLILGTAEVVEMLSEQHHGFVRSVMACQIRRAALMGRHPQGACLPDHHAQMAGRSHAWATHQLMAAFPAETWYRSPQFVGDIPSTVDVLLERIPPADRTALDEPQGAEVFRWSGDATESDEDGLPGHGYLRPATSRKRLSIAFWAVRIVGHLPYGDGASCRLFEKVSRWSERLEEDARHPVQGR